MEQTINERLAVLEVQIEHIAKQAAAREATQATILSKLDLMQETLVNYEKELTKYRGFLGGIVFIISCLGAFFAKFGMILWTAVKR